MFLEFVWEGKEVELRGIAGKLGKIINSNGIKNILNKENKVAIS